MVEWSDARRFLAEDLIVYSGLFATTLFFDHLLNLLSIIGITILFNREVIHPHSFGSFQALGGLFFGIQLIRKLFDWRFYA